MGPVSSPYLCVTGFQAAAGIRAIDYPALPAGYRHIAGVLVQGPSAGGLATGRCASVEAAAAIAEAAATRGVLAVAHLVLRRRAQTAIPEDVRVVVDAGFRAMQVNALDLELLAQAARSFVDMAPANFVLILQLSHKVLADHGLEPALARLSSLAEAARAARPDGEVHVLFDQSGGRGLQISLVEATRFLDLVEAEHPALQPAIAGGLGPGTIGDVIRTLAGPRPRRVSFDAESALRDAHNRLDIGRVNVFLDEAARALADVAAGVPDAEGA